MNRMSPGRIAIRLSTAAIAWSLVAPAAALAQEKPPSEQAARITPLKVTVVISRFQGEKKTGNLPFVLTVNSSDRTSLRMGAEVPIPQTTLKEATLATSYQYRSVGTQIDCRASAMMNDGRVALSLTVNDNQLSMEDRPDAGAMRGLPRFSNFTSTATLTLRDGQTMEYTAATDKTSGEVVRVQVTLNVVK